MMSESKTKETLDAASEEAKASRLHLDPAWYECVLPGKGLGDRFTHLVQRWKKDTQFCSSPVEMAIHPAYQQIIGMGPAVLPLIFNELAKEPDDWFWALAAITGENPVPVSSEGRLDEMVEAWLQWGREQCYVDQCGG